MKNTKALFRNAESGNVRRGTFREHFFRQRGQVPAGLLDTNSCSTMTTEDKTGAAADRDMTINQELVDNQDAEELVSDPRPPPLEVGTREVEDQIVMAVNTVVVAE